MSAIERPLAGGGLHFRLDEELKAVYNGEILAHNGRTGRTLVNDESLRVTINLLLAGGAIAEHHADGPITVQVLRGSMTVHAGNQSYDLREGDLLALDAGIPYSISARDGVAFLVTISLARAQQTR